MTAYTPHTVWAGRKPNAFTAIGPAMRIQPTRVSKKLATRINREAHLGGGLTNSEKAPR